MAATRTVNIIKRFTDTGNRLYGPGPIELNNLVANRLVAEGRATELEIKSDEKQTKEPIKKEAVVETKVEDTSNEEAAAEETEDAGEEEPVADDIPESFPERAKLIAGGITTVAQLKEQGVATKLAAIGLTQIGINRVALAITELE